MDLCAKTIIVQYVWYMLQNFIYPCWTTEYWSQPHNHQLLSKAYRVNLISYQFITYCTAIILQSPCSVMTQGDTGVLVPMRIYFMLPGRLKEEIFWMHYLCKCLQCASNNSGITVDWSASHCTINAKEFRGFQRSENIINQHRYILFIMLIILCNGRLTVF